MTTTLLAPCSYCGKHDDQEHIMLTCTHPALTPIRTQAKRTQSSIASQLKEKHRAPIERYFISQLTYASWIQPSTHTKRIWLGLWNADTLGLFFPPALDLTSPMPTSDRYKYRSIARQLTAPLIHAYNQMIRLPHHHHTLPTLHTVLHTT